ncbi:hypothetical protein ACOMHN_051117 [Nucella lapillus]
MGLLPEGFCASRDDVTGPIYGVFIATPNRDMINVVMYKKLLQRITVENTVTVVASIFHGNPEVVENQRKGLMRRGYLFQSRKDAGKAACGPTFPKVGQSRKDAGKAACGPTFPKVGQSRKDAGKAACGPTFPKVGQSRKDAGKAARGLTSPKTGRSPKEPQMFGPGRPESRGPQGETNGGLKSAAKTEPQLLRVNRVCASSSGVNIVVGGLPVEAKIDSGAEITILSTTAFERLREKPKKLREVNMQLADQGSTMRGFVTRPVGLKIGGMTFHEQVHVAPISDQMLLGHDLLHH